MMFILGSRRQSFENGKTTIRKNCESLPPFQYMIALNANRILAEGQEDE